MRRLTQLASSLLLFQILLLMRQDPVIAQKEPSLKIQTPSEEVYQAIIEFYQYDTDIPLQAVVVQKDDFPEGIREKVVFRGVGDIRDRVPAYLGIPKVGTPPYPLVIEIDGLTGSKERWWQDDSWPRGGLLTKGLLSSGFAVMALDVQYHGERIAGNDYESPGEMLTKKRYNRLREMTLQSTVEHRRAMDYLATRAEIDTSRIGVIGHSLGGLMTFYLSAVDPRIKVSVACVTPIVIDGQLIGVSGRPQNFASRIGKNPFLMLIGNSDPFYIVEQAQQLYRLIDSPVKDVVVYDSGHRLPEDYVPQALKWFQDHLK